MEDQLYIFDPGTNTSKCPMPTTFEHRLGWVDKIERFLTIHNQQDIVNVNKLLEQTLNLQISNIIQRVIAQVIGETETGFVTIKGTDDGALHVSIQEGLEDLLTGIILAAGTNLIGKIQVDGHAYEIKSQAINKTGDQVHDIIAADGSKQHHICSICFTVAGDVTVTLRDETGPLSGAMNFGGTGEPMGMCHNHELAPLPCHAGEKFQITLDAAVLLAGYVTYYSK